MYEVRKGNPHFLVYLSFYGFLKPPILFTGPEPVLGLQYSVVKRAIGDWMERKHIECWKSGKDSGPQQGRATKLLNMSRQQLSVVIGLRSEEVV